MRLVEFARGLRLGRLRGRRSLWAFGTIAVCACVGASVLAVLAGAHPSPATKSAAIPPRYVRKIRLARRPGPVPAGAMLTLRLRLRPVHTNRPTTLRVKFWLRHARRRELGIGRVTLRFPSRHAANTTVRLRIGAQTPQASYRLVVCAGRKRARVCIKLGSVKIVSAQSGPPGGTGGGGPGGGGPGAGGPGAGPLCSPSPCQAGSLQSLNVTVDDGAGRMVTRSFGVERPINLVNSPSHPVPVVITFWNNQNWVAESAAGEYVVVFIAPLHNSQYAVPTISPSPSTIGAQDCGPSGTGTCDDIPWVQAALSAIECSGPAPCQNINPQQVYATGGSRGGTMTEDVMCDPRTSSRVRAYSVISELLISPSPSNSQSVLPRCPALLGGTPNTNLSALWIYGTADPYFSGPHCASTNDCLGTGFTDSQNRWQFGDEQLATTVFGRVLGCPSSPTTTVFGNTGQLTRRGYVPCRAGAKIATETIAVHGGGHVPDGSDGLDIARESWNFFQTYG